jgi:hypothetical protein
VVQGQSGQKLLRPYLKNKLKSKRTDGVAQVLEWESKFLKSHQVTPIPVSPHLLEGDPSSG